MPNPRQRTRLSHYAKTIIDRTTRKNASQNKFLDEKIEEYEKLIEQSKRQKEGNDMGLEDEKKALITENERLKEALRLATTCKYCESENAMFHSHRTCLIDVSTIESTLL